MRCQTELSCPPPVGIHTAHHPDVNPPRAVSHRHPFCLHFRGSNSHWTHTILVSFQLRGAVDSADRTPPTLPRRFAGGEMSYHRTDQVGVTHFSDGSRQAGAFRELGIDAI